MKRRALCLAASLAFAAVVLPLGDQASAASFEEYENRNAFNAAIVFLFGRTELQERWDDVLTGTVIPDGTLLNGIIYSTPGPDAMITDLFAAAALSPPNTLGDADDHFFDGFAQITFGFPSPIIAFGISFVTNATFDGAYTLTVESRGNLTLQTVLGVVPSFFDPFPGLATGQFAGFISDTPFDEITITPEFRPGGLAGFSYVLDDLTYVLATPTAVPEPATLILLGSGLAGLGALARRRSRRSRHS